MNKLSLKNQSLKLIHRWPTIRSRKWTANFLKLAQHDDNIMAIVAVGSAIRPAVRTTDLDVVVICNTPAKLTAKPPVEVDLRAYAAEQVDTLLQGGNDMLGWAVKFGRVLFQRQSFWDGVLEAWLDRIPLPSVEVALRRAEDAFHRLSNVFELGDVEAAYEQAVSYVTHLSRAELIKRQVYPASRPELPGQLRSAGCPQLAAWLDRLLDQATTDLQEIPHLLISRPLTIAGAR
jgi:hypothetical protein